MIELYLSTESTGNILNKVRKPVRHNFKGPIFNSSPVNCQKCLNQYCPNFEKEEDPLTTKKAKRQNILVSRKPAMLRYQSQLTRVAKFLLFLLFYIFGIFEETQKLTIVMFENLFDGYNNIPIVSARIQLSKPVQPYSRFTHASFGLILILKDLSGLCTGTQ
ncbi:uncharacterized protein LOC135139850 [Zophobas morio]|uniref:uncharacterized protein LOC135139850 n=1 Tax=Zophobas morio TaxID=2755281 RepID=UPI003082BC93